MSATLVKKLREITGSGILDCKKALAANENDIEKSVDWLRATGLSKAARKADRETSEGVNVLTVDGEKGFVVQVSCETDFVARNEKFQELASNISKKSTSVSSVEELLQVEVDAQTGTVEQYITAKIAEIGENIRVARLETIEAVGGGVFGYIHNQIAPNMGKIASLVALSVGGKEIEELGRSLAMHVAAMNPLAKDEDGVPAELIARERAVLEDKAKQSGKPDAIIEKIVQSGIKSYCKDICLLQQIYVLDGNKTVKEVLAEFSKKLGKDVQILSFIRVSL